MASKSGFVERGGLPVFLDPNFIDTLIFKR